MAALEQHGVGQDFVFQAPTRRRMPCRCGLRGAGSGRPARLGRDGPARGGRPSRCSAEARDTARRKSRPRHPDRARHTPGHGRPHGAGAQRAQPQPARRARARGLRQRHPRRRRGALPRGRRARRAGARLPPEQPRGHPRRLGAGGPRRHRRHRRQRRRLHPHLGRPARRARGLPGARGSRCTSATSTPARSSATTATSPTCATTTSSATGCRATPRRSSGWRGAVPERDLPATWAGERVARRARGAGWCRRSRPSGCAPPRRSSATGCASGRSSPGSRPTRGRVWVKENAPSQAFEAALVPRSSTTSCRMPSPPRSPSTATAAGWRPPTSGCRCGTTSTVPPLADWVDVLQGYAVVQQVLADHADAVLATGRPDLSRAAPTTSSAWVEHLVEASRALPGGRPEAARRRRGRRRRRGDAAHP